MSKVVRIGGMGDIVDYICDLYDRGELKSIAVTIKEVVPNKPDEMSFVWHGFDTYAEQLGACEMMKEAMFKRSLDDSGVIIAQ